MDEPVGTVADEPVDAVHPVRRIRWGPVTGIVTWLALVLFAVHRALAVRTPATYRRVHEAFAGLPGRTVLAAIGVAVVFHTVDGIRRLVVEVRPSADRRARALVRFATAAVSLPVALSILWPSVGGWFA